MPGFLGNVKRSPGSLKLEDLLKRLADPDPETSEHAARTMGLLLLAPLDDYDPELIKTALETMVQLLGDSRVPLRKEVYKSLYKLKSKVVHPYAGGILHWVCADDADIRLPAYQLLVKLCLSPVQLAPHVRLVIDRLLEDNNDVQLRACKLLVKLKFAPEALEPHAGLIASQLADDHPEVALAAYQFLVVIRAEALGPFAADIAHWLNDDHFATDDEHRLTEERRAEARLRACRLLMKIKPQLLGPHAGMILKLFRDDTVEIQLAAFQLLQKVTREALGRHARVFVEELSNDNAEMRLRAFQLLLKLSPDALEPHAKVIMQQLGDANAEVRWKAYRLTHSALGLGDLKPIPQSAAVATPPQSAWFRPSETDIAVK